MSSAVNVYKQSKKGGGGGLERYSNFGLKKVATDPHF